MRKQYFLPNIYVIRNECTIYFCDHKLLDNTSFIIDYYKIFYEITNQCTTFFLVIILTTDVFEPRHKYVHICNIMYMKIQIQNTKVCTSLGTNLRAAPLRFGLFVLFKHIPRLRWTDYK